MKKKKGEDKGDKCLPDCPPEEIRKIVREEIQRALGKEEEN